MMIFCSGWAAVLKKICAQIVAVREAYYHIRQSEIGIHQGRSRRLRPTGGVA